MSIKEEIVELHTFMTKHVIGTSIQEKTWINLINNLDRCSTMILEFIKNSLTNLKENEWAEIQRIWTLPNVTEEMWENYEWMFDGDDLPEQKMLTVARKAFVHRWRIFRKRLRELKEEERAAKKIETENRTRG